MFSFFKSKPKVVLPGLPEWNTVPWTKPQTPGQTAAAAALEQFPDVERVLAVLHYGMTGQEPLVAARLCAMVQRSLIEVMAQLHAAHLRVRNNQAHRLVFQALLSEHDQEILEFTEEIAGYRLKQTTSVLENHRIHGFMRTLPPISRFALEGLYDHPLQYGAWLLANYFGDEEAIVRLKKTLA